MPAFTKGELPLGSLGRLWYYKVKQEFIFHISWKRCRVKNAKAETLYEYVVTQLSGGLLVAFAIL